MKSLPKIYSVGDRKFIYDHASLRYAFDLYEKFTNEEFLENAVDILHFAVYVCWLKEIPSDECLADDGIIHELVHLIQENTIKHSNLENIRKKFNKTLTI
jgi:hypothetical protein